MPWNKRLLLPTAPTGLRLLDPSTHPTAPITLPTERQPARPKRLTLRRIRRPLNVPVTTWHAVVYDIDANCGDVTLRRFCDLSAREARVRIEQLRKQHPNWSWQVVRRTTHITEEIVSD